MPSLPSSFGASEVITAAKLNEYMEYMESLAPHQAAYAGSWIFGDVTNDTVFLSAPQTDYSGSIETIVNNSNNTREYILGPTITVTDAEAVLYFLDMRIHTASGGSGSIAAICQVGHHDTVGANSAAMQNNTSTAFRSGITGLYDLPDPAGEQQLSIVVQVPDGVTFVCAQRRLTVIQISKQ